MNAEDPHPAQPRPNFLAVERIADLDGNPLPRPILKGLFTPEVAHDYVARHHGPYKASAFRVADLVQEPGTGRWVAPGDIQPGNGPQPEAGLAAARETHGPQWPAWLSGIEPPEPEI